MKIVKISLAVILLILLQVAIVTGPWTWQQADAQISPKVGVFYYPWYGGGEQAAEGGHKQWYRHVFRTNLQQPQQPALGQYHSQDPAVIGQHIAWSREGGIDAWITSWWGPGDFTDVTLRDHILKHPDASELEYAILYEAQGRLGDFNNPDFTNLWSDVAYLKQTYFCHPNYLKIGGKPVLYFYLSREYFKGDGIEALRELKRQFPEIYLIGDDLFQLINEPARSGLLDAVNNYDVYGQSFKLFGEGSTWTELYALAQTYRFAARAADRYGFDFIPSVAPGYNDRAVRDGHQAAPRYLAGSDEHGNLFREVIRKAALPFLDAGADHLMFVTSFNEWYEDTQLEPTAGTAEPSASDSSDSGQHYAENFRWVDYGTDYLAILSQETRAR